MPRLDLNLIKRGLEIAGLQCTIYPGAFGRGHATIKPKVIVYHDDIIPGQKNPPALIAEGVQQPSAYVPGPLYNIWVGIDGHVWLIANGKSNNAGRGGWRGHSGNSSTIGLCRSHHPHTDKGAPDVQMNALYLTGNVLSTMYKIPIVDVCEHSEWQPGKSDMWNTSEKETRESVRTASAKKEMTSEQFFRTLALAKKIVDEEGRPFLRLRRPRMMSNRIMYVREITDAGKSRRYDEKAMFGVMRFQKYLEAMGVKGIRTDGKVDRTTWYWIEFARLKKFFGFA